MLKLGYITGMKVLLADKLPAEVRVALSGLGYEVDFQPDLTAEDLPSVIGDFHVLVVRSTKVNADTLSAAQRLQLIVRAGAGVNTIDTKGAAERGIYVANCPGKNAVAVAELTFGLILALDRRIPDNVAEMRQGNWLKGKFSNARGLMGRSLGVIGLGPVGREVIKRAHAFGLGVVAWSRSLDEATARELDIERCDSIRELCARADIISVHVALTPETRHLIGAEEIAAMRAGAFVVNTSRGGVVDDEALGRAVELGQIRAAADVFENEPASKSAEYKPDIAGHGGFYGTHHIGASTDQAQEAVADEVVRILEEFVLHGEVSNTVNVARSTEAAGQLIVRHLDRVGVLAHVLDVLRQHEINVQELQNTVFEGGEAASAKISLSHAPDPSVLAEIRADSEDVLSLEWIAR